MAWSCLGDGFVFAVLVMLAMLVPAGVLWATTRAYDLIMDHRDRQRRRRVRRAIAEADTMSLAEWARRAEQGGRGLAMSRGPSGHRGPVWSGRGIGGGREGDANPPFHEDQKTIGR